MRLTSLAGLALAILLGAFPVRAAPPAGAGLVWSENFDAPGQTAPDPAVWSHDIGTGDWGWGNGEAQYYTDTPHNVFVADGMLHIRGVVNDGDRPDHPGPTSARLVTRAGVLPRYGAFEIRALLPCGHGAWPAIWMLGQDGPWPLRGEIDIAEWSGAYFSRDEIQHALHTQAFHGGQGKVARFPLKSACGAFHVFRLGWTATELRLAVDGDLADPRMVYVKPRNADARNWPYDQPAQLLLNVAIGGTLGGTPDPGAKSFEMLVDYIRIYSTP